MNNILWLASWYPDELGPYNGDFIQRHARAVSEHISITVIYMAQHGPEMEMPETRSITSQHGNLTEVINYFSYKKTGIPTVDRLRYNLKYFVHYRKFMRKFLAEYGQPPLIHVHVPMKAGRIAFWLYKNFGIPYIVTEHSSAYSAEVPDAFHRRGKYYRNWVTKIFQNAKAVTTVSQKLGYQLKELFALRNMNIIPNVADTRHFNFSPVSRTPFRFLHASTMDHPKNVEGILRALNELKKTRVDWECILLGWDTPQLRTLATTLNLDGHVVWKGVVSYQQVAIEMKNASALLMFSRYENMPCTILEALCCGLPVVATSVGGIPEVINGTNGILVQNEDDRQLVNALNTMMDNYDQYDRSAIAAHAQACFSYQEVGKQFVELYNKILGTEI